MTVATILGNKVDLSNPGNVEELILDGHKIKQLSEEDAKFLSQFSELKVISMNQTYLSSLAGLPPLAKLETLELTDNKLGPNSALESLAKTCPNLHTLILAGNRLTDLSFVRGLEHLEVLDVEVNPITASKKDEEGVRAALFKEFPNLKIVNSHDREGNAIEDDESGSSDEVEDESDSDATGEPQIVGDDVEMM
eukprot:Gregarina_sp_Pseudo_9__868@NODE_1557_length_1498_cov_127_032214_g1444_i0_p1_GENE_NODE_1557_length_1498_cov_127_032214_g1444_i0NODE_1557_length_1498_cov_127_032214_g1444_i0_p1_ORF_typecomplete_len194_score27_74LRR_9/PF14580_6/79LRR_9/PF14580_6/2_2e20LRR_8/PF13855_6/9_7e05LRR_8/PF13855_6/0_00045LRR_8/PF13855_6/4_1e05LRR_4/PF12799_7/0_58LRR_4/PF12799_7/9_4e08LRR_4/PF12799_7/3_3e03LRR_6/PF13516_6/7LRR_6/PF13516_6/0_38LRR_6/PF13516_6/78LRR_6/PF13516_6/1_2e04LRR_12/PF18837_1/9_2e02LRR_12/PF18837_1/3_6